MKALDDAENIIGILKLRHRGVKIAQLAAFDAYSSVDMVKMLLSTLAPLLDEEAWQ